MSDQNFREIQLSGKQLIFLFMSAVVLAVVIFLLGVSVGRGVRGALAGTPAASDVADSGDTVVPADVPPPVVPKPSDLDYHETLQGQPPASTKPPAEPPPPVSETPASAAGEPARTAGAASKPAVQAAAPQNPAPRTTPPPATEKPAAPVTNGWFVQINAFSSKANADREVARLKAKGLTAFVYETKGPGPRFRSRVGPFASRAEADAMAARLKKEGFTPSVTR